MSERKWERVTDPSEFRQGWEVKHVVEVAYGVTRKTRGIFGGYDEGLGVRSTHNGRIGDFRVPQSTWFQRPPKIKPVEWNPAVGEMFTIEHEGETYRGIKTGTGISIGVNPALWPDGRSVTSNEQILAWDSSPKPAVSTPPVVTPEQIMQLPSGSEIRGGSAERWITAPNYPIDYWRNRSEKSHPFRLIYTPEATNE